MGEPEARSSGATCHGPLTGTPANRPEEFDLEPLGYVGEEWFLSGTATSWRPAGALRADGSWDVEAAATAPFTTRLLVRRPADPGRFNGVVIVEWLNVSGGGDGAPDWTFLHRHVLREGAAWVGVSAQKAGIDGGGLVPGEHLKKVDPDRYRALDHPGDAFAYDIFSQAGAAVRSVDGPLATLDVDSLLAIGESQSAIFLVTYVNTVDRDARVYDGFVLHGRGAAGATLDGSMGGRAQGEELDLEATPLATQPGQRIRADTRVPVITVQSETDVIFLGGLRGRQPDGERFRLWEIAGAAHFDTYGLFASRRDDGSLSVAELARLLAPTDEVLEQKAESPVNSGPQQHYVLNAAVAHLLTWVRDGTPPPGAPRLDVTDGGDVPALVPDELGIARGGIRTPWVDVPVAVLSGLGQHGAVFTLLFGVTRSFDDDVLGRLYPGGRDEYLAAFARSLDETINAGFILEADRAEILGVAAASTPWGTESPA